MIYSDFQQRNVAALLVCNCAGANRCRITGEWQAWQLRLDIDRPYHRRVAVADAVDDIARCRLQQFHRLRQHRWWRWAG